ncbi:hypothetical protein PROFUN_13171 [Planoprotostelium fungivorum]|uniref:BTB domain-containing protein n=1 Tax=Planoprotostelium fungivorum TaxID=1890364 RepID=A0A2P6N534_9EUKA|nr:hypothetical protein PROFUN_13171 [Planoprotostelium fungivorum]
MQQHWGKRNIETLEELECRLYLTSALERCTSTVVREQLQGISILYDIFSRPIDKSVHSRVLREIGGLAVLISLLGSQEVHGKIKMKVLYTLWNLSALSDNKVILYEEGVAEVLLKLEIPTEGDHILVGVIAIMQNISEYKFGERNPNQVHLYQCGVFNYVAERMTHKDIWVRFLSCMAVANLANNHLVRKMISADGCESVLQQLTDFVMEYKRAEKAETELFKGWLSLEPHIPLLCSNDEPILIWSLFCVCEFAKLATTQDASLEHSSLSQIWHDLGLNQGVAPIRKLSKSKNQTISHMANSLINLLDIKEEVDMMTETVSSVGSDFYAGLMGGAYTDISFNCNGSVLHAHRIVLASRCPALAAMFSNGLAESSMKTIPIHFSKQVFATFIQFLYTADAPDIDPPTALELLDCADMFNCADLKLHVEDFLWNFIEPSNIFLAALTHHCARLEEMCVKFILRNFRKLQNTEEYRSLDISTRNKLTQMWEDTQPQHRPSSHLHLSFTPNMNQPQPMVEEERNDYHAIVTAYNPVHSMVGITAAPVG